MYPSPDAVPGALHAVVAALATDNAATARTHMDAIAFHRQDATLRRPPSPQALAEIYDRDRYQCRYCGRKTVLIEVMPVVVKSNETGCVYGVGCGWSTGWLIQATLGNWGGRGWRVKRSGCSV
jgi:hypothetical protein